MVENHCATHKVNLSVQDVIKSDPEFKKIENALKSLYAFYNEAKRI